jgi:glyoxalase family protein
MRKLQTQGVHHITLTGADRQTSIDFWEGVLGMPFVFDQPNLDNPDEGHLYFDPGDGRLITVFTNENRKPNPRRTPTDPGCVHHLAFNVSKATFSQAVERLDERGIRHSGPRDRGFMDSIYFTDPMGLLPVRAAHGLHPCRCDDRGAPHPGGARRLQHRRGAPGRRDRIAGRAEAAIAVGRPRAREPLLRAYSLVSTISSSRSEAWRAWLSASWYSGL